MKENATNFEQFEALLKQKSYDDLSDKEKGLIAEFCDSAQEYGLMRKMILAQAPIIMPAEIVPENLLEKVAGNAKSSEYQRFMNLSVPFWAYLLSLLVVFGLTYFLRPTSVKIKEVPTEVQKEIIKEVPKEIIKTDTVIKYAYRVDTVYLESKKSVSVAQKPSSSQKATLVTNKPEPLEPSKKKNQHPVGRTIKQDRDLKAFFTDIQ